LSLLRRRSRALVFVDVNRIGIKSDVLPDFLAKSLHHFRAGQEGPEGNPLHFFPRACGLVAKVRSLNEPNANIFEF